MPELTDEAIKRKHNEFNKRIRSVLDELQKKSPVIGQGFSPNIQRLRETAQLRRPRLPMRTQR